MNKRNAVALVLIIASLVCLYPGLTKPIIQINIGAQLPLIGEFTLFERTQSVVESIQSLFETDNDLVAWLILIFSIIVPITKAVILLAVLAFKKLPGRKAPLSFCRVNRKVVNGRCVCCGYFTGFLGHRRKRKHSGRTL